MTLEKVLEKVLKTCRRRGVSYADEQAIIDSIKSLYNKESTL